MSKINFQVEQNILISTAHVPKEDMRRITCERPVDDADLGGYFFDNGIVLLNLRCGLRNLKDYSGSFRDLFAWAQNQGEQYTFLKLDPDGPVMEGFPTFEW